MSRYIDVELLKNKILEDMAKAEREGRDCNGYTDALFHLKTMPTADVVEVKHGHWEKRYSKHTDHLGTFLKYDGDFCSFCGALGDGKYCSECGARMDGERRAEE